MTAPLQQTDGALVERALRGDDDAFRALVIKYQSPVLACTRAITRNAADADDAGQEAFIRLHRHLEQFDPGRALKPYLLRIAANCARDLVAKRARNAGTPGSQTLLLTLPAPGATPEKRAIRRERRDAVRELVDTLPATLREVCCLFYLAECACREVAEILEMSETAVKVALHRARRKLRQSGLAEWRSL